MSFSKICPLLRLVMNGITCIRLKETLKNINILKNSILKFIRFKPFDYHNPKGLKLITNIASWPKSSW